MGWGLRSGGCGAGFEGGGDCGVGIEEWGLWGGVCRSWVLTERWC